MVMSMLSTMDRCNNRAPQSLMSHFGNHKPQSEQIES